MTDHSAHIRTALADRYTIERELGRGGMATVFLARDRKHDRPVAVKVLHPELAAALGAERFLREIRLTAQLQHPHILTLIDSGESGGFLYYVMPYVEGETLRQRLARERQLPLDEALRITRAVATALDYAHARGVVHRDIKPENVLLHQGEPMVADFGIALAVSSAEPDRLTATGLSLGTPAYMSPEQANADPKLDGRSDQYSLASMLYEMLAGEPPYTGPTAHAIIAKRFNEPVPHLGTVRQVPPAVETAVMTALAKAPADRFATTGAFAAALSSGAKRRRPLPRGVVVAVAVLVVSIAAAAVYAITHARAPGSAGVGVVAPLTSTSGQKRNPAFSPDGNEIAYVWRGEQDDNADIYVQLIDAGTPLRLTTNPAPDRCPAWSPDGHLIAFFREAAGSEPAAFYVVPALGGSERRIAEAYNPLPVFGRCIDWSPDGKSLLVADKMTPQDPGPSVILVSTVDAQRKLVVSHPALYVANPTFSPDGRSIAYVAGAGFLTDEIQVASVAGGSHRLTSDGSLVGGLAWTKDGKSIVFGSNRTGLITLWRVAATGGAPESVNGIGEGAFDPAIAPRGNRLSYLHERIDGNVWRMPGPAANAAARAERPRKLLASSRADVQGVYSPDGRRIAFSSDRSGTNEIWVADSDGTNPVQLTAFKTTDSGSPQWSPDGSTLVFDARLEGHGTILTIPAGGGSPRRLTTDSAESNLPSWSRDGKSVYYSSRRTGRWEIWKVPAEGGTAMQVTRGGGFFAQEAPDGKSVFVWGQGMLEGEAVQKITPPDSEAVPFLHGVRTFVGWLVRSHGIYFFDSARPIAPLRFFDFATKRTRTLGTIDFGYATGRPAAFDISPDERWILFDRVDAIQSDIMLVQNFRQTSWLGQNPSKHRNRGDRANPKYERPLDKVADAALQPGLELSETHLHLLAQLGDVRAHL